MAKHLITGKEGEDLAIEWLQSAGFFIIEKNWKYSYYEIDVIASRGCILHFIEVKSRTSGYYGHPEDGVSKKKFRCLLQAAEEYQYLHSPWPRVQYDILSITFSKIKETEFYFIEDVWI